MFVCCHHSRPTAAISHFFVEERKPLVLFSFRAICSSAVRGSLTRRRSTTIASQRDTEASRGGVIFWNCTASRFVLPRDGCCTHTLWVGHRSLACSPMHARRGGRQAAAAAGGGMLSAAAGFSGGGHDRMLLPSESPFDCLTNG